MDTVAWLAAQLTAKTAQEEFARPVLLVSTKIRIIHARRAFLTVLLALMERRAKLVSWDSSKFLQALVIHVRAKVNTLIPTIIPAQPYARQTVNHVAQRLLAAFVKSDFILTPVIKHVRPV